MMVFYLNCCLVNWWFVTWYISVLYISVFDMQIYAVFQGDVNVEIRCSTVGVFCLVLKGTFCVFEGKLEGECLVEIQIDLIGYRVLQI